MNLRAVIIACVALQVATTATARAQMKDDQIVVFTLAEQLEYQRDQATNPASWELVGWVGGDINRIWWKSEGAAATSERDADGELQVLYGRLVTPFWDLQVGIRGDAVLAMDDRTGRLHGVIGLEGLAPGWFDIDVAAFVSHRGDVSARLEATYDLLVTQRLIVQPRFELDAAVQDVPEFGVGTGLNSIELGVRVRYDIRRKLAPYLGVTWERLLFETRDFARVRGEDASAVAAVAGLRLWY